jgi:hypothetical protein
MTGSFTVELEAMAALIRSLSTSADHMSSATGALKSASTSDLGSEELDDAAEDFHDQWKYGIWRISQAARMVTDDLQTAKNGYEAVEQEAIAALQRIDAGLPPTAPSRIETELHAGQPVGDSTPPATDGAIVRALGTHGEGL